MELNSMERIVVMITFALCCIVTFIGIWNNFLWIGKDGQNLPYELRPGFFGFWFVITPRYFLRMKTGMEKVT